MQKIIIIIFTIFLFIIPLPAKAVNCSYEKQSRLKQIASNINYDYVFHEDGINSTFTIRFINIEEDVYLYDVLNSKIYTDFEINITNMKPGNKYHFIVKSKEKPLNIVDYKVIENNQVVYKEYIEKNDSDCSDELRDINIVLPAYNPFYSDILCKGIEDSLLCYKWYNHSLSKKDWEKAVGKLKKMDEIKKSHEQIDNINFFSPIFMVIIFTSIIIFLIIITTYLLNKKKRSFNGW